MIDLTTILAELPKLNADGRQAIRDRLNALESLDLSPKTPQNGQNGGTHKTLKNKGFLGPQNTPKNDDFPSKTLESHDILRAICDFMTFSGLECPPLSGLQRSPQYRAFEGKIPALCLFIQGCNRIERQAIIAIGVELLYRNLSEMGVAVTSRTLMSHIHRLPAVVNRAFPGYSQNGLLRMIARKVNNGP